MSDTSTKGASKPDDKVEVMDPPKAPATALNVTENKELPLRERLALDMQNTSSNLRNQVTVEDTVDFQLLSNTPAQIIVAMTGKTMEQLKERADEIGVTLKGSLAGSMQGDS